MSPGLTYMTHCQTLKLEAEPLLVVASEAKGRARTTGMPAEVKETECLGCCNKDSC